jgi:hypothetical protein
VLAAPSPAASRGLLAPAPGGPDLGAAQPAAAASTPQLAAGRPSPLP